MDTSDLSSQQQTSTSATSSASQVEATAADALTAGFTGLASGGPVAGAVSALMATVNDLVTQRTAPIEQMLTQHTASTGDAIQTIAGAAAQTAGAAMTIGQHVESSLAMFESRLAAFESHHAVIGAIVGILGRMFPHEVAPLVSLFTPSLTIPATPPGA